MEGKKTILLGLGFFQRALLEALSKTRPCVLIDSNAEAFSRFDISNSHFETLVGEASSIVTWKKVNLEDVSHIVSSLQDYDVVMEVCRILRDVYKIEIPIIVLWYGDQHVEDFERYNVKVINPLDVGVESVLLNIEKNYSKPTNIGLGQGEIVEVSITRRSHLVDRKMRYLKPNKWRVAAAYRDAKLIMPDGDFKLKVGDKAILVGEPKVIENIVNILTKGTPEFPLQYGQSSVALTHNLTAESAEEFAMFSKKTRVRKLQWHDAEKHIKAPTEAINILEQAGYKEGEKLNHYRSSIFLKDVGLICISGAGKFTLMNTRMRYLFRRSCSPFLISRNKSEYSEIVVSLNSLMPYRMIEIGAELSALFGVPFRLVYVAQLGALKTSTDEFDMRERQTLVNDYENLTRSKVEYNVLEGNPVKETLKLLDATPNALVLVSADSESKMSWLNPHVPYILSGLTKNSVLVLPSEPQNE